MAVVKRYSGTPWNVAIIPRLKFLLLDAPSFGRQGTQDRLHVTRRRSLTPLINLRHTSMFYCVLLMRSARGCKAQIVNTYEIHAGIVAHCGNGVDQESYRYKRL
jgi:hypothetical protein